jgi:uncharacterized peroxidase-related enzyme
VTALPLIDAGTADARTRDLLATVQSNLGVTPNMTKAMANSPALLQGYLGLSGGLATGVLRPAVREQIALTVAQRNGCAYCLSAHSYLAEHAANLDADAIDAARKADSGDPKTAAVLALAAAVNDARGDLEPAQLAAARGAGLTHAEIAETIGHVALNVLTNYFNKAVDVEIDFPLVEP